MSENETMNPSALSDAKEGLPGGPAQAPEDTGAIDPPRFFFGEAGGSETKGSPVADSPAEGGPGEFAEVDVPEGELGDSTVDGPLAQDAQDEGVDASEEGSLGATDATLSRHEAAVNDGDEIGADLQEAPERESKGAMGGAGVKVGVVVAVVAALLAGLLIGAFALNGGQQSASSLVGKSKVAESELESAIASYTVDGKTETITVKEVLVQTSLEDAKDESGNYTLPPADVVLAAARNKMLVADAAAKGIQVSDEEVAEYAMQQLKTSDYESIGSGYGIDAQSVLALLRDTLTLNKLRESVMGDASVAKPLPEPPIEPTSAASSSSAIEEPEDNEYAGEDERTASEAGSTASGASTVSKAYANYIIALAGDEWDKEKGTWASTDGPYYQGLSSFDITPEGASYEAAMAAYYVAYQAYSQEASATANTWTDYANSLFNKATITIYTVRA